jgi:hypothetical protein
MLNHPATLVPIVHPATPPVIGVQPIHTRFSRLTAHTQAWLVHNVIPAAAIRGFQQTARPVMLNHLAIMVPIVRHATRPAIGTQLSLTQILVAEAAPVTIEPPALIVTPAATIPLLIVENAMTAIIPEARVFRKMYLLYFLTD